MRVALIGGIGRLTPHYEREAKKLGHELRVFNAMETGLVAKIGSSDVLLLCTGKMSHCVRVHAMLAAKHRSIPVVQFHSCGVCALRGCMEALGTDAKGGAASGAFGNLKAG